MARKKNINPIRDRFYIITNGRETEKNYFDLLKSKKSIYEVSVEFKNADPLRLVEYAISIKGANQIWVVFDIDNTYSENRLVPAITKARKNGIKYAFSNVSFEVWLISHYEKLEKPMSEEKLEETLTKYLSCEKQGLKYNKNDKDALKEYFIPKYKTAITNAKTVYQKRNLEHIQKYGNSSSPPIWEWNSCTNVFMLVEALNLRP